MKKQNYEKKEISSFPQKNNKLETTNIFNPTQKKIQLLFKPDFSPITKKENLFELKNHASYKRQPIIQPESPLKAPNSNYFIPIKIEGKNLFDANNDKKFCSELKFDDIENKEYNLNDKISIGEINFLNKFNNKDFYNSNNISSINEQINELKLKICNNRMEHDFEIIKTIKNLKFDAIYIVKEKKPRKYVVLKNKKIKKK